VVREPGLQQLVVNRYWSTGQEGWRKGEEKTKFSTRTKQLNISLEK